MNKERNLYLDVLKGVCIILVIIGHCIQYGSGREYYSERVFFANPLFIIIYSFHMPLFMLISGYLFAYSIKNKRWDELLYMRSKQLIVPLLSWSIVSIGIKILKSIIGISTDTVTILWIIKNLISGFFYGPWFLWAVFWCGLVITIVRRVLKDNLVVYLLGTLLTFIIPDILNLSLYKFMWPFFLLAYLFHEYGYQNKMKKLYLHKFFIICCSIVFCILLFFFDYDSYIYTSGHFILNKSIIEQISNNVFRFFIGMFGSISAMYLIYALMPVLSDKIKSFLAYLGKNTLGIYVISGYLFSEVLLRVTVLLKDVNYLYILIEAICILSLSIGMNKVLKKYKMTNTLFLGGR